MQLHIFNMFWMKQTQEIPYVCVYNGDGFSNPQFLGIYSIHH